MSNIAEKIHNTALKKGEEYSKSHEYLHKQCGVNPKWEWLYRIFWRGKKYFKY